MSRLPSVYSALILIRVQGLDLQLYKYAFNAQFIDTKHLQKALIRSHGSLQENELSRELNRSTEHNTQGKLQG